MNIKYGILGILLLLLTTTKSKAQHLIPVDDKSSISFSIGHKKFGYHTINGTFKGVKGEITFDPAVLNISFFNVSVADSTIRSGNDQRDHDLREKNWLDAKEYPYITLLSTKIEKSATQGLYLLYGDLNIKGTILPVVIAFKAVPTKDGNGYTFTGILRIHRLDYGLGVGDTNTDNEMLISISLYAERQ